MARIDIGAQVLKGLPDVGSVLDVGARDGDLADSLPTGVSYTGADLFPDKRGRVRYVGDIQKMDIAETFDAVVAMDILEHLESPSSMFDRLVQLSRRYVLVSLPNCYDLKSRVRFATVARMNGKYAFLEDEPLDRHRWLMNHREIMTFYKAKAKRHELQMQTFDMLYGTGGGFQGFLGTVASKLLPPTLTAQTVFGLFTKN